MAMVGLLIMLLGFGAFIFCWAIECKKIASEADEKRANEIADEMLANAEIRVIQRLYIIDEMK